jgi:hypothetical protein
MASQRAKREPTLSKPGVSRQKSFLHGAFFNKVILFEAVRDGWTLQKHLSFGVGF